MQLFAANYVRLSQNVITLTQNAIKYSTQDLTFHNKKRKTFVTLKVVM